MKTVTQERNSALLSSMKALMVYTLCAVVIYGLSGVNKLPWWRIVVFILVFTLLYKPSDLVKDAFKISKATNNWD